MMTILTRRSFFALASAATLLPEFGTGAAALADGLATGAEIVPFRIDVADAVLTDLNERLDMVRWPTELPDLGWSRGVPLSYLKELVGYWRHRYDWRKAEAELNAFPQFTTVVDGQLIHFIHVRSPEPDATPLLLTHGWPGSVVEFLDVIGPLADPRRHGNATAPAFHVVVPSIPGFGFSSPLKEKGWGEARIAEAFVTLMERLGYPRFGAHAGDWGAAISRRIGLLHPDRVIGLHMTQIPSGTPKPEEADMSNPDEKRSVEASQRYQYELLGYGYQQSTRPQTLAYGLADSPVGQLAWIVEKFKEWTDSANAPEDAVSRDRMLTNVMLYWLTNTAGSSANLYVEGAAGWGQPEEPSNVPTGIAVLPRDISYPIRRFAERSNTIVHWTVFDRGGHFGAMEEPELMTADIRKFFAGLAN